MTDAENETHSEDLPELQPLPTTLCQLKSML